MGGGPCCLAGSAQNKAIPRFSHGNLEIIVIVCDCVAIVTVSGLWDRLLQESQVCACLYHRQHYVHWAILYAPPIRKILFFYLKKIMVKYT